MSQEIVPAGEGDNLLPFSAEAEVMSTVQVAELTGKQHKSVLRDCRNMFEELGLQSEQFCAHYLDTRNRKQEMFNLNEELSVTLVAGYNTKLRNAVVKEWKKLRTERDQFVAALQNSDPQVLQYITNMASAKKVTDEKLIEVTEEKNQAITRRAQISTSREATMMSKLAHMTPIEYFNEDRIKCLEVAASRGLITVKEIGRRVRDMLGSRLVYHPKHTQEADPHRPDHVNQALIDLGYQVEVPDGQRDTKRTIKNRKVTWHNRYEIPKSGFDEGSKQARHAGVVLSSVSSYQSKYGFEVRQSLQWHPNMVKVVYEYMQRIKRDKEAAKEKK
jgi:phage regulator Rha-like protein